MKANTKLHRSITIITLLVFIITFCLSPVTFASDPDQLIYEKRSSQTITSGVTHESIQRFMYSGWLNINIVTVDLTNPFVKMDLLTSPEGLGKLSNVKTMADSAGSVAAINGDFFEKHSDENITSGGYPMGFAMKSGNIVSTSFYANAASDKFASFSLNNLKQALFAYVSQTVTITAPNGQKLKIPEVNKISSTYKSPVLFNKYWGRNSIGSTEKFPTMTEMVVDNGVVTEIRFGMPPVEIPQNGYVISARQEGGKFLKTNFKVGDPVQLDIKTTPDMSNQEVAIGGGSKLVKNGQLYPLSHDLPGLHPRSAVGVSADNKYLYMVTVDGRQTLSRGVTLKELGEIMIEIGAYNALNFDGGGSTTLVGRPLGSPSLEVVNSPSETTLRKVADALGVFTTAPRGTLKGLVINTVDENIFVNTKREFKVKGYDEYYNPIDVNTDQVSWSISGINGYFTNNILTPLEVGEGTVTASIGNVSANIPVSSLSSPVEMTISPKILKTSVGKTAHFVVRGKNKNGFWAVIDPSSIKVELTNHIGQINGNSFTASSHGNSILSCSSGNVKAYAGIMVSGETTTVANPCEDPSAVFKGYPSEVAGAVYTSNQVVHSGLSSYKLVYDFTTTDRSRAAYTVFPNNSIPLGENTTDFGLWVYNPSPKSEWLKAQITDAEGSIHLVDISRSLSWSGWKFIKVPLGEDIPRPAQISRIYVVQIEPGIKSQGEIYFDDITLYSKKVEALDPSEIPDNLSLPDEAEKAVPFKSDSKSFQFVVMGKIGPSKTLLDKINMQKITSLIESKAELAAFTGDISNNFYKSLKNPVVTGISGNSTFKYKNSTFISLDDSKNGIRQTDAKQWKWFESELGKVDTDNLFVLLPKPVSGESFSDPYEAKLFNDILTEYRKKTGRNVWLITGGSNNSVKIERGVRSISAAGLDQNTSNITQSLDHNKYILVTVKGREITYQIKNLM